MELPSVDAIIRDMYFQQVRTADKMNADGAADFWQGFNASKLNWEEKGTKFPYAQPRLLAKVIAQLEMPSPSVTISLGPELCVDPLPTAPWDVPAPPKPQPDPGFITFYDVGNAPYVYGGWATGIKPGEIRVNPENGLRYMYVESGYPGTINFFRGWRLINA